MDDVERRRQTFEGEIVAAGTPKPRLRPLSPTAKRLAEFWQLCVAQWRASGRALPEFDRATMPGEVFRIER